MNGCRFDAFNSNRLTLKMSFESNNVEILKEFIVVELIMWKSTKEYSRQKF